MSGKMLVFLAVIGSSGYALQRAAPPVPPDATAADSVAIAQAGVGARFQYGMGSLGSKLVGNTVRGMVDKTEQTLLDLRQPIKTAKGGEGERARKIAKKIELMDSIARMDLQYGRPIKAMRGAMEAQSLVNGVRTMVKLKI